MKVDLRPCERSVYRSRLMGFPPSTTGVPGFVGFFGGQGEELGASSGTVRQNGDKAFFVLSEKELISFDDGGKKQDQHAFCASAAGASG